MAGSNRLFVEAAVVRNFVIMGAASMALGTPATAQQQAGATAKPLTRTELTTRLDSSFATIDANKDGSLNADELGTAQKKELEQVQGALRAKVQEAFQKLDTNKDGQLSKAEFAATVPPVNASETPAQVIQKIDSNKDGKVTAEEFKAPRLAAFNRVDTNKDGTVTAAELRASQQRK
jgi:Ca2+-binding EF-hand superfamily protein